MTLLGVHEAPPADARVEGATARYPLSAVERVFVPDIIKPQALIARFKATCQNHLDAGKSVIWSFKPSVAEVTSLAWRPYIQGLAQYITDKGLSDRVILVFWHEPENDFILPSVFVRMFNACHDWVKAVDPAIQTSHAALGYRYKAMPDSFAAQWVTRCDIHSIDIYSGNSFPLSMTLGTSEAVQRWLRTRPAGFRWGVSERGWIADAAHSAERVASIDAEFEYLGTLAVPPEFYCVWDTVGTENNANIPLDDPGRQAVNRGFALLSVPRTQECPLCHGAGHVDPTKSYVIVSS